MRLIIEGRVRQPWEFAFDELVQMPSRTLTMTLECAGNSRIFLSPKAGGLQWELGAVGNAEWTGVLLAAVLKRAGVKAGAAEVVLEGADSGAIAKESVSPGKIHYARSLPLAKALMPEDVQAAVRAARSHGLPLSVRGGGHDWAGRVLRHDGLVIDLSVMRKVTVDAAAKVATVAGGATAADVTAAISEHGLAAVTGNVGAVGIAGLFLEGGYGPLTTRFGLLWTTCSALRLFSPMAGSLLPMRRKTPICSGHFEAEAAILALVTSMRLRLHPVGELLAGIILFPWSEAQSVLRGHAQIMSSTPDELSVLAGLLPAPDGRPVVFIGHPSGVANQDRVRRSWPVCRASARRS